MALFPDTASYNDEAIRVHSTTETPNSGIDSSSLNQRSFFSSELTRFQVPNTDHVLDSLSFWNVGAYQ